MKRLVFALILINIVFLSGCTSLICEPDYVRIPGHLSKMGCEAINMDSMEECCKTMCFNSYQVASYKIEPTDCVWPEGEIECISCLCDVNDCG